MLLKAKSGQFFAMSVHVRKMVMFVFWIFIHFHRTNGYVSQKYTCDNFTLDQPNTVTQIPNTSGLKDCISACVDTTWGDGKAEVHCAAAKFTQPNGPCFVRLGAKTSSCMNDWVFGEEQVACINNYQWKQISGGLKWAEVGAAGVWGVSGGDSIYYRQGSYGVGTTSEGSSWPQVGGGLSQVSVGKDIVWGRNSGRHTYIRHSISSADKDGVDWTHVPDVDLDQVSVSSVNNEVWGIDVNKNVYWRAGVTDASLIGSRFEHVNDGLMKHVSVDGVGAWAVDSANKVYYRTGTHGSQRTSGTGWELVDGTGSFTRVGAGLKYLFGIKTNTEIWVRIGITSSNPTGVLWKQIPSTGLIQGLQQVSAHDTCALWGTDASHRIWMRKPV